MRRWLRNTLVRFCVGLRFEMPREARALFRSELSPIASLEGARALCQAAAYMRDQVLLCVGPSSRYSPARFRSSQP